MKNESVIQFVCFDTPLPKLAFVPLWTPFATTYLEQGLHRIVLRQRIGSSVRGDAPDFISRNHWPAADFERVLADGRIGNGGRWPVRASQGGSFVGSENAEREADSVDYTVIALLNLHRETDKDGYGLTIEAALADFGPRHSIHTRRVAEAPAQFDAIVEVFVDPGTDSKIAERLAAVLSPVAKNGTILLGSYQQALILPNT